MRPSGDHCGFEPPLVEIDHRALSTFENGRGTINLSAYWQLVSRGDFLLIAILLQTRVAGRQKAMG